MSDSSETQNNSVVLIRERPLQLPSADTSCCPHVQVNIRAIRVASRRDTDVFNFYVLPGFKLARFWSECMYGCSFLQRSRV